MSLNILSVFPLKNFGQLHANLVLLFLRNGILLVEVINDEEVFSFGLVQVQIVDPIKIWHAIVDDIAEVIISWFKNIVIWIDKHHRLIEKANLQCDQENVSFLIKDHDNISEFETTIIFSFQRNTIKLVVSSRLVVVHPDLLVLMGSEQNFLDFLLTLLVLIYATTRSLVSFIL